MIEIDQEVLMGFIDVGGLMLVSIFQCWWQKFDISDIVCMFVPEADI